MRRTFASTALAAALALSGGGCTKKNPSYCETSTDCADGEICDLSSHGCVANTTDASLDADTDAAPPACDVTKPFLPATEVPGLHDPMANDVHASLTANELTIYFASNRSNYASTTTEVYRATRATRDASFGTPTLAGFATFEPEGANNPAISADGNTIFYDSVRMNVGVVLLMSSRADATSVFAAPMTLATGALVEPAITADGTTLYATNLGTGRLARLQKSGSTYGPAQDVDTQLAYTQVSPATSDDLALFMTLRNGAVNVTKRTSTSEPWPTPTELSELQTHDEQFLPSWVSGDGCRLYLTYTPTAGKSRIMMATRPK